MAGYNTILVAIDCSDDSPTLLQRADSLCSSPSAMHLLHVIEPLALAYGADVPMDVSELQHSLTEKARETAHEYARQRNIPDSQVHVELGSIEKTIQDTAERIAADLIVIGSHTRHGLAVLLGSTAKGIVPGAHCDVLAVKVDRPSADADSA